MLQHIKGCREKSHNYGDLADLTRVVLQKNGLKQAQVDLGESKQVLIHVDIVFDNNNEKNTILVDVGLNIFVELTFEEANKFANQQTLYFANLADELEQSYAQKIADQTAVLYSQNSIKPH